MKLYVTTRKDSCGSGGKVISYIGLAWNSSLDIIEGEYKQLGVRLGLEAVSFGIGRMIDKIDKPIIDQLNKSLMKADLKDIDGTVKRAMEDLARTQTIDKPILEILEKGLRESLNKMAEELNKIEDNKK